MTTLTITEPYEYVDNTLATASWWDKYEILPGAYEIEWVTIDHKPWRMPDPDNVGQMSYYGTSPYYGKVTLRARLLEEYRVNRLFTASSASHDVHDEPREVTLTRTAYAYQFPGCPGRGQHGKPLTTWYGGTVTD